MHLGKWFVFGIIATVVGVSFAEEAVDRKTATSLKYVTHELDTRQNKFGADTNKAMEYTDSAGMVQKRAVTSDLDNGGTESLPMVGGVNTKLNQKQDDIAAVNDHTAVTYTGTAGGIGQKGIYQTTESYADQSDNLIDAKTFNAALKNGLDSEFKCREDNLDPVSGLCWLYTIHNTSPNLFDKNNLTRIHGYFPSSGSVWTWADLGYSIRIPCQPSTTYTARYNGNSSQVVLSFASTGSDEIPSGGSGVACTNSIRQNNPTIDTPITFTTGPNDKWLIVAYNIAEPQNTDMANNLQVEIGSTATPYRPYINNVYIPQNQ